MGLEPRLEARRAGGVHDAGDDGAAVWAVHAKI